MLLQAQLVHADSGRRVVLVSAHEGQRLLGSALGEAADAEEAEERAIQRLLQRLGSAADPAPPAAAVPPAQPSPRRAHSPSPPPAPEGASAPIANSTEAPASGGNGSGGNGSEPAASDSRPGESRVPGATTSGATTSGATTAEPSEPPPLDPEDWSTELSQLELQLQRIGWGRQEEGLYLQRAFGHPSRSRITTYNDLAGYLRSLEGFAPGADPASALVPLRRRDLLSQCDQLLAQLGWEPSRGRSFLSEHLGATSRSQLSDAQLLAFNMLLEGELINAPLDCHTPGDD